MSERFPQAGDPNGVVEPQPRTPEDVIARVIQDDADSQRMTVEELAGQVILDLQLAGYEVRDTLKQEVVFTRDQVEAAWNAGADMVLQDDDLQLGGRDADLVNLVCNAIGTCLDNPGTDDLDDVILANYDPELDEEDEGLSDEDANAKRVRTVKGWIY